MAASPADCIPLLELAGIGRSYRSGDIELPALRQIDLRIDEGEMIAIMGASGSGKSTLMNMLGCLDRPSRGSYRVNGLAVDRLDADALASLRREHFGFVFQRYQLLPDLSAIDNVMTPAIYAGLPRAASLRRAQQLLARLDLGDRAGHRPSQLSGGQQQRVSVARALMNGGRVILADEPTGALDSHGGQAIMALLAELNQEGHTVIIVTHDPQIASHAARVIDIRDGRIVSDRRAADADQWRSAGVVDHGPCPAQGLFEARSSAGSRPRSRSDVRPLPIVPQTTLRQNAERLLDAMRIALLAVARHRLRAFLTMLGIIIGVASVGCVVALGEGSRLRILRDIRAFDTQTIHIYPGAGFGSQDASAARSLTLGDVQAIGELSSVDGVTPIVTASGSVRHGNVAINAKVEGVNADYVRVRDLHMAQGQFFDAAAVRQHAQEAVIDERARDAFFSGRSALGEVIFIAGVPCRVIGVARDKAAFGAGNTINVWLPHTSVMSRISGQTHVDSAILRIADHVPNAAAEQDVSDVLRRRHGRHDFHSMSLDTLRGLMLRTNQNLNLLLSAIALISLIVGGIGVMNIMLVSVTERTREIGVRMAVGARRQDIQNQFLIEAIVICLAGGVLGIALALAIGALGSMSDSGYSMVFSATSLIAAFCTATLSGVVFGFMPAHRAARMHPVDALARE